MGALTTHRAVAESDLIARECPVLAETAAGVGDMQVRNRGTIGGSIAHADPHADLPAVLVALGGEVVAEGPGGQRTIAADELFLDYLTTAISADEILTEVRVPKVRQAAYVKFNRRMQDWAVVGVAAAIAGSGGKDRDHRGGVTPDPGDGSRAGMERLESGAGGIARRQRADATLGHRRIGRIPRTPGERAHPAGARGGSGALS